ncbi:Mariner Mos1 transposase [Eumeta japonica]|uniref:Mariner Mos1 transposase n=1 Tax=Eumeta variegata TaxID=151549 RepID=A0A4C1U0G4_EUMVA|nr:Mariner Mos1 transposase [Eumeta japonica]
MAATQILEKRIVEDGACSVLELHRSLFRSTSARRLRLAFHDEALFLTTVYNWFKEFKRGRTNLTDGLRSHASTATTEDDISAVRLMIEIDKRNYSKLSSIKSNWVPYELKPRDVECRLCTSEMLLARLKRHCAVRISSVLVNSTCSVRARFTSYEDTKNWVNSWIASKDKEFFSLGIRMLPERW